MASKGDIQATRSNAAAAAPAIIAPPVRLRAISVAGGAGAGVLELTTTSDSGATLLYVDVPAGDVYTLNLPEDGILFPKGIFCKTFTNIVAYTLFTDKYSGPGLTAG